VRGEGLDTYANPYAAGAALGLVLLASFAIEGRGLGASGAFAWVAARVAPVNAYFERYAAADTWLVLEIAGVIAGGFLSAALAGRLRRAVDRGANVTIGARIATAFAGGAAMGIGAALARGCTSGLALSGGALLSAGSWAFMMAAFAAGFALAPAMRWAWR
jgi:uncharacterized membrane protein YedE/YeeE